MVSMLQKLFGEKPATLNKLVEEVSKTQETVQSDNVPSEEVLKALNVLGLESSANIYDVINAYNWKLIELNPLTMNGQINAEELNNERQKVWAAYKTVKSNSSVLKQIALDEKLNKLLERHDALPVPVKSRSIVLMENSVQDNYNTYLERFQKFKGVLNEMKIEKFCKSMIKIDPLGKATFNETYSNPRIDELVKYRQEGFTAQPMPGSISVEINDISILDGSFGWWAVSEGVETMGEYKTEDFPMIFRFKDHSDRLLGKHVDSNLLLGLTSVDFEVIRANRGENINSRFSYKNAYEDRRTKERFFLYQIGSLSAGEVPKPHSEIMKEGRWVAYEKLFGFAPPSDAEFQEWLMLIHDVPEHRKYSLFLVKQTAQQLTYPLRQEVMEMYRAARDSGAFEEVGFLDLKEREIRKSVDPIMFGTIFGGLRVPLCYWK